MLRTSQQIEGDFYALIKGSMLGYLIRGSIYRKGMRPANADTEDIVVGFLAGTDGTLQKGVVVVNIYVPDITSQDGTKVRDISRIERLEGLIDDFITTQNSNYWIETQDTPTLVHNNEINQWCIVARFKFEYIAN